VSMKTNNKLFKSVDSRRLDEVIRAGMECWRYHSTPRDDREAPVERATGQTCPRLCLQTPQNSRCRSLSSLSYLYYYVCLDEPLFSSFAA